MTAALVAKNLVVVRGSTTLLNDVSLEVSAGELVAEDLRHAHQHLGEITGEFTTDDLLGRIFTSFCVGK